MKKIDLHTHTICTKSDAPFVFSMEKLRSYVDVCQIDALAITNHNLFNLAQYEQIGREVAALIIPGIEIDFENGHLLLLCDPSEVVDFSQRCEKVERLIDSREESLRVKELKEIFTDLNRYILIPHYDKTPVVHEDALKKLQDFITAGEVASPKKFVYCKKSESSLVPVYFSDTRFAEKYPNFPIRQTYIDVGEISFGAIKYALRDKNKVFLTKDSGHSFFQANEQGLVLSTGLNVVIGERSSGKSYTLNQLEKTFDRVKYIRQFSLVERSDEDDSERFNEILRQKQSLFIEDYLREFKAAVDDIGSVDIELDERELDQYVSALLMSAREHERADSFSKASIFSEVGFSIDGLDNIRKVIESVITLLDNEEFRSIIDKHVSRDSLKSLAVDLIEECQRSKESSSKKTYANDLIASVKSELQRRTAVTPVPEIDLYAIAMNRKRVSKLVELTQHIQVQREIFRQDIQAFRVVANTRKFRGAVELKTLSGKVMSFLAAFQRYGDPYGFLVELRRINGLPAAEYYKYFVAIEYKILNRFGYEVSGGERSEFRLLQEISDALQYDMLLIDEPESSFDNVFLNSEVNQLIKDISRKMPVVLVTHNSTVGASIKPDYLLYTKRIIEDGRVRYKTYFGHPSDKFLRSIDGGSQKNHQVLLSCLEAGVEAYSDRGATYEVLKN